MNIFKSLYCYELKKILQKKIVWITAIVVAVTFVISVVADMVGTYYVDGVAVDTYYHMYQTDRTYRQALDGRVIDQTLLEEMKAGYDKLPAGVEKYSLTEEYNIYARPYSAIFNWVKNMTGMYTAEALTWTADEADMYARHENYLKESWKAELLTDEEKEFWQQKESELTLPVTYKFCDGYDKLMSLHYTVGIISLAAMAICMAGIFTEEHTRKTDQLILCSRYGREKLYWAKLAAGVSFSALLSIFYIGVSFLSVFVLHGLDGFTAPFRLLNAGYSYDLTVGEAILIMYGMIVAACIVTGVFTMVLSEWVESNIGALSIVVGMIILSMFVNMPEHNRFIYQLWNYLPSNFVAVWSIFSKQTVSVFGKIFTAWQAVPVMYMMAAVVLMMLGRVAYVKYQVKGR